MASLPPECGLTDCFPLEVMEEVIWTFINRAAKKNIGSLLHPTSLLMDQANCNKKSKPQVTWSPSSCHDEYEGYSSKDCGAADQMTPSGDSLWWLQPLEDISPSSSKTHFLFQFLLILSVSCQDTRLHANPGTPAGRLCTWRNSGSRSPSQMDGLCPMKFY